jgi:hypothetical protein
MGGYDAMNKGIDLANGELIGLLNSDDWYEINCCEIIFREYIARKSAVLYKISSSIVNA